MKVKRLFGFWFTGFKNWWFSGLFLKDKKNQLENYDHFSRQELPLLVISGIMLCKSLIKLRYARQKLKPSGLLQTWQPLPWMRSGAIDS
jgi:uncharacterized membrane protein affecting hemolysin expression